MAHAPPDDNETGARAALAAAVEQQTDEALRAWAATGRSGLAILGNLLRGAEREPWRDVHPRDEIDGLADAVAAIAARHPAAFLEIFSDARFASDINVLVGLSWIDDPEATRRLLAAADAPNPWVRQQAIIGLGRRRHADAQAALVRAIGDTEYLVRYHALVGLAAVGTPDALVDLRAFVGRSDYERELATTAIGRIEGRGGR